MWTPRRLMLLIIGFVFYLTGYFVYARSFLGGIDGLPALPDGYQYDSRSREHVTVPLKQTGVEEKLKLAFGRGCTELNWPIKLELRSKNMVLAAEDFSLVEGRVRLKPLSVAVFGKDKGDGRHVEINTIKGKVAYLKFDRPVVNLSDIGGRKIVSAELMDDIMIVNNRRTPDDPFDDLVVHIGKGPLFYEEEKHLIWTHDDISLMDYQSRPKPMTIRGGGMEMELLAEAPAKPGGQIRKPKQESVSGVKRIVLQSNVDMELYAGGGFGGNKDEKPAKNAKAPEPEKSQIRIKTPGKFQYDFGKEYDLARFDVPDSDPKQQLRSPQDVEVERRLPQNPDAVDRLVCQHLALRVRRKQATPQKRGKEAPAEQSPEQALEVETAHATGPEVTVTSDQEKLQAHCVDLFFDARTMTTTLKGNPMMKATKDDNDIYARELQIQEVKVEPENGKGEAKKYQQILARGPGNIDLQDKALKKKTLHAYWNDKLTTSRDGPHDLLVLTGAARFVDTEHNQTLQADTLKVWFDDKESAPQKPKDKPVAPPHTNDADKDKGLTQEGRRPHKLEANGNVLARSRELHVHDTSRLVVWFKDVPEEALPKATQGPASGGKHEGQGASETKQPASPVPSGGPGGGPKQSGNKQASGGGGLLPDTGNPADGEEEKTPRPIDISARSIEAWVLRSEVRNTLDKLWTVGSVHVQQDPAKPEEKGVDIKGDELSLNYHPDGSLLVVTGDLAQLRMDKIFILGPEVNIDQLNNKAWVTGPGAMQMESATTFTGPKLEKSVPLTVHWTQSMLFNGKFAEFHGGIQAEQDNGRLACQVLQVFFDRPISLKEGNHSDKPAKVQNLMCDRNVRIEETTMEGDKLVKYQKIEGREVSVDTIPPEDDAPRKPGEKDDGNEVRTSGPGTVRIFQKGGPDPLAPPPEANRPAPPKPMNKSGEEEMKLTYVSFAGNMYGNSKTSTAIFWTNVRVLNMPSDSPYKDIDLDTILDNLPREALYLSCDQLTVLARKENGVSQQEMQAKRRVVVQAREFWGRADMLTYNEGKDQIIFFGKDTEPAALYRVLSKGSPPEEIKGKKIIYIRSTGAFQVDGGNWINGAGR